MLLQNKHAVVYGAGGSLGGAISRGMAKAGATMFLCGHHLDSVQKVADEINAAGGKAEASKVDALDEKSVNSYLGKVKNKAGNIDISFNAISVRDTQDIPLVEMSLDDFVRPVDIAMRTQFITATAVGRIMMKQRSGVIMSLTATPGGIGCLRVGGFGPTCCAIEGFSRDIAAELGPYGVRAVNIRSAGSPDSQVFLDVIKHEGDRALEFIKKIEGDTMLKELPMMEDIANVAVFLASGMASKITGVTVDVTCGTTAALNYKISSIPFGANK